MQTRAATVKVGLLTIISLTVLITAVIWLRGRALGGGRPFEVLFTDVDGLRTGAPVQFMGIRVGFVDEVIPVYTTEHKYRVNVRFTITEGNIKIPRGSVISLEQSGIIGEKFVEITPPRPITEELILPRYESGIHPHMLVMTEFSDGMRPVGEVLQVAVNKIPRITSSSTDYSYEIAFVINRPGYLTPEDVEFKTMHMPDGQVALVLKDPAAKLAQFPNDNKAMFSIEEPLRLKEFLELQLASAESLKVTNDKINKLLSDEAISTLQGTFKNSEHLTAQASQVLAEANVLFRTTSHDIHDIVRSTQTLSGNIVTVSQNINALTSDPQLKGNVQTAVASLRSSSEALTALLQDPNLKLLISDARTTSQNSAELMQYIKKSVIDNDMQGQINQSLTLLNTSLNRMSAVLSNVETVTNDKESLKAIIQETRETAHNLNQFSDRLNKRFLLFRLMF